MRIAVVQIEVDVVARPPSTTASTTAAATSAHRHEGRAFAKIVNEADGNLVVVLRKRCDEMKIPS